MGGGHFLQSPWLQFPGQVLALLPLRELSQGIPWAAGEPGQRLMQIPLLQAQPQNPGSVPALELQGPFQA